MALEFQYGFVGYGSYNAPIWTVSLEPGGASSELPEWHASWQRLGRGELLDPHVLHDGYPGWFGPRAHLQPTWAPAIVFGLAARGVTLEELLEVGRPRVLEEQRDRWCRDGQTVHLHLSALPARGTGDPQLRELYRSHRIELLAERLRTFQPRVVLFMGITAKEHFAKIAGDETLGEEWKRLPWGGLAKIAKHPGGYRGGEASGDYAVDGVMAAELMRNPN